MLTNKLYCKIKVVWKLKRTITNRNLLYLKDRDFFQDIFPDNAGSKMKNLFASTPQTIYAGFDPTADSLHIGNLLVLIGLLHSQRSGHQPIALIGGATARIGDPSGRNTERNKMDNLIIESNSLCIEKQIERIFENHQNLFWNKRNQKRDLTSVKILNNNEWYSNLKLIDFIGNMGRHFRMGSMLSRSSVQSRLNNVNGMSFTEFTYQIFQAYDWLHLLENYNCRFQIGGSDQMGNFMTGHELISRVATNVSVFGMTLPIITTDEGDKFGKSAGNAMWLNSEKTSTFALYQFFIRRTDKEVEKLLKLLTFFNLSELNEIIEEHKKRPQLRVAQKILASEITLLVHGENGLKQAENVTNALYNNSIEGLGELNYKDIQETFVGATVCEILQEPGISIIDLAMKAKCFPTESDASRIISAGGFYINQKRTENIAEIISPGIHILKNKLTLIRVGKKNYFIIKWLT